MAEATFLDSLNDRKKVRLESGEADRLSSRTFNLLLMGFLLYGFLVNAVMVYYFASPIMGIVANIGWWSLLLYLVPSFIGVIMAVNSNNPAVSFLGYNLVVLPFGMLLAVIIPGLPFQIVVKAMILTAMVTATMMVLASIKPAFFLGLGRTLLVALVIGIVAELVATFLLGYRGNLFDWLFVILFSGYIGFDIAKSQAYPKTLDNAIDSALDIYLDVINLFIRLLSILSRSK